MKIGIMGAMEEEIKPFLNFFKEYEIEEYANNKYYKINYEGKEIVLAYSKIGKVFSALTATILIEHFKCEKILFTGVAGAINENLGIGDLVISTKLCQHDIDITAFGHKPGYLPGIEEIYVETNQELVDLAEKSICELGFKYSAGCIATGDQFIAKEERKNFIKKEFEADAIEMEGASVALVCRELGIPCLVLRSISDTADMEANFDFQKFVNESAEKSAKVIEKLLEKI